MSKIIVRARQLVNEGDVYSGDWGPNADFFGNDCTKCEGYHVCVSIRDQYIDLFTRYRVSRAFEQSILENGIIHPLSIESDYYDDDVKVLCNGHHRLKVAYKYNLYVPIEFTHRKDRWNADEDEKLPNSGDPSRYYHPSGDIASFDVTKL